MNTRTFPRTMDQAFPRTTEYACAVERPARQYPRAVWLVIAAGFVFALIASRT